jgi:hypothetical protein
LCAHNRQPSTQIKHAWEWGDRRELTSLPHGAMRLALRMQPKQAAPSEAAMS